MRPRTIVLSADAPKCNGGHAPLAVGRVGRIRSVALAASILLAIPQGLLAKDLDEVITKRRTGTMLEKDGQVNHQPAGQPEVSAARPQPLRFDDTLRTLALAWAAVHLDDGVDLRMEQHTRLQILRQTAAMNPALAFVRQNQTNAAAYTNAPLLSLLQGALYLVNRTARTNEILVKTPQGLARPKGTEFLIAVDPEGRRTEVTMFDGEAELTDGATNAVVRSGQQAIVAAGQGIRVRPILEVSSLVQWWLYYPGVLDPDELQLNPAEQESLRASLEAYRAGDLATALQQFPGYPAPPDPAGDDAKTYLASLFLSVSAVAQAEALLAKAHTNAPLARALRTMIDAVIPPVAADVRRRTISNPQSAIRNPQSSSELLALSYAHQSTNNLAAALRAARQAVERSPQFGFGWARVAELEFSFGRIRAARDAVARALDVSPQNAQAHALNGFLLAAENRLHDALAAFNEGIRIDPALGNAWLGRGLCKRRLSWTMFSSTPTGGEGRDESLRSKSEIQNPKSKISDWLSDLQTATILEPQRSLVRSYAGKAFGDAGDFRRAEGELDVAKRYDPNDPTPWLYSALLLRDQNRFNEAVGDLERSVELNNNRAVYRSGLLLDQDRAVRGSSLASIYRDTGLNDVSVREAARAVSSDYASFSSHQFLAESYNALRDPTRFNLRYETPWFNELLLANLLSPVGGTPLSQHITQQEYSRLFERNRIGLTSSTEYRSDGQVRELASQYGVIGNTGWSLDLEYQHHDGVRPNNELDSLEWYTTIKQQITPQDSALVLVKYQDYHSGDNFQYYDPRQARPYFSFDERQDPIVMGAWHHEWSPGMHTLFLGGRLINQQQFKDRAVPELILEEIADGTVADFSTANYDLDYHNEFEIYSAELNQLFDWTWLTLSVGARYQCGELEAESRLTNPSIPGLVPRTSVTAVNEPFERISGYGYVTVKPVEPLRLTGGLAYDQETIPSNFRHPPLTPGEDDISHIGPKAAIVWDPRPEATVRGVYTRSLGGVSLDQSYRLEPTQLAGFPQTFRTVIPESVRGVGSVAAPTFETLGLALDLKFRSRTYVGIQAERVTSDVWRDIGVFVLDNGLSPAVPGSVAERLEYEENTLAVTVNQLLGNKFALGVRYALTRAELNTGFSPSVSSVLPPTSQEATLHQVTGYALFNHASGFFARAEVLWYSQQNGGDNSALPGDDVVQENLYIGYRFARSRGELRLGLLNLSNQDYRLNPLTAYQELPRERIFEARLSFRF